VLKVRTSRQQLNLGGLRRRRVQGVVYESLTDQRVVMM
jgi:hypothetical protein